MDWSLASVLLAVSLCSSLFYLVCVACTFRHTRRSRSTGDSDHALPGLSLLKPVKGREESLEDCLRSVYAQRYEGEREVIFAAADRDDEGLAVARRVAAEFPDVPTRFVLTDPNWGFNPKVSNLQGALQAARHNLVLQSDANVLLPDNYLRDVVEEFQRKDANLLSSLVTGIGEESFGAAAENLHLSSYVAPATCAALHLAGVPCVIGKSMLFRRSELQRVGGLALVKDALAEDFLLGRTYAEHGLRVVLSATPIWNYNRSMPLSRCTLRHSRWLKMRAVIHPPAFLVDPISNPTALWFLCWVASAFSPKVALFAVTATLVKTLGDAAMVRRTRGQAMALHHLMIAPLKDLMMFGVWLYASVSRSVEWRGVRLRIGQDSRLYPDTPNLPRRILRRLLT